MKKVSIRTTEEIFRIRNYLQQISHISYTFANLNKRYPLDEITEEQAQEIVEAYINLIRDTEAVVQSFNLNLNPNDLPNHQ